MNPFRLPTTVAHQSDLNFLFPKRFFSCFRMFHLKPPSYGAALARLEPPSRRQTCQSLLPPGSGERQIEREVDSLAISGLPGSVWQSYHSVTRTPLALATALVLRQGVVPVGEIFYSSINPVHSIIQCLKSRQSLVGDRCLGIPQRYDDDGGEEGPVCPSRKSHYGQRSRRT